MDDWNDPRLALAVVRAKSLTGAARALGINHSTAFRRLAALEARLGARLFERLPGGAYAPTAEGARVALAAERMEDEALSLARDVAGGDGRLSGRLRVTCSETLATEVMPRHLAAFRRSHPGIVVELAVDFRVLDLARREADVALRPTRPRESALWGRRIAGVAWCAYAAPGVLEAPLSGPADLARAPLIGWEEGIAGLRTPEWLARVAPDAPVTFRTNSLVAQRDAARAGMGVAVLPCYLGDARQGDGGATLMRVLPRPVPELAGELWIVTHADLRRTARVRAFFDVVGVGIEAERALLEGDAGP